MQVTTPPLPTLLQVFEAEADERAKRRTDRLLRASRLSPGKTGRGKTHAAAALGHALVQRGHAVLLSPTFRLAYLPDELRRARLAGVAERAGVEPAF